MLNLTSLKLRTRVAHIVLSAGLLVSAFMASWWLAGDSETLPVSPLRQSPTTLAGVDTARSREVPEVAMSSGALTFKPPVASSGVASARWFDGFARQDLYAEVVRLRNVRERGSLAASMRLTKECLQVLVDMNRPRIGDQPSIEEQMVSKPDPRRYAAKQELEVRCLPFNTPSVLSLNEPLPDDQHGKRFLSALDPLRRFPIDRGRFVAAAEEIVEQGQFEYLKGFIVDTCMWRGVRCPIPKDEFKLAVELGFLLANSEPGGAARDLRVLSRCYRSGQCDPSYEAFPESLTVEQRFAIRALAQDMAAAFRAGDLSAWAQPAPAPGR